MARDRGLFVSAMIIRLGFLLALVLGISMSWLTHSLLLYLHAASGVLLLVGGFSAALVGIFQNKGSVTPLLLSVTLMVLAAMVGVNVYRNVWGGPYMPWVHAGLMLLAVGLAEMGMARLRRTRQ